MAEVEIQGLKEKTEQIERLLTDNPEMRKRLNGCIRTILKEVQSALMASAQAGLNMNSDPRKAYKAVRYAVYRRIVGGQVNILQSRKAGPPVQYKSPRTGVVGKRGGNRWRRSDRTYKVDGYEGKDRGFVLRFLNQGTQDRNIHSYTDRGGNRNNLRTSEKGGNRGSIAPRNWFGPASQQQFNNAASDIEALIDRVLNDEFK